MTFLTTSLLLVCVLAYIGHVSAVVGTFKAANGYECGYNVQKQGKTCRELHINCRKKKSPSYNCVYSGNPHGCNAYNKNANSFNDALCKVLGNDANGACNAASVTAAKKCPGVVYQRQGCHGRVLEEIIFREEEFNNY